MVNDCYIVDLATPLAAVLRHMATERIGSAVVMQRGKLAGVFTANDACRASPITSTTSRRSTTTTRHHTVTG